MYQVQSAGGDMVWCDGDQKAMDRISRADRMIYDVERIIDASTLEEEQRDELKEMLEAARYYLEQADKEIYGEKTAQEFEIALEEEQLQMSTLQGEVTK